MSDHPRIKREDPARSAPIRDWSNMYSTAAAQSPPAPAATRMQLDTSMPNGAANGSATLATSTVPAAGLSEEARAVIETAYRVIDEHLQEGRRAAQVRGGGTAGSESIAAGTDGAGVAADSIQEILAQGIRFYSSLAPLWVSLVNAIANSAATPAAVAADQPAAPLAPRPMSRAAATGTPIVGIASSRMTRVTVDLAYSASAAQFAIGGLQALEPEKPPLREIALAFDASSNRTVVRIRVPESQPGGVYSGVIVDRVSGEPRGTVTLRIDA